MPDGCTKCIIDPGMGVNAAHAYTTAINRVAATFPPVAYAAADFYAGVLADCKAVADRLWPDLSKEQRASVNKQFDEACYRADAILGWVAIIHTAADHIAGWTAKFFEWAKDDQNFFTALIKEVEGPKP